MRYFYQNSSTTFTDTLREAFKQSQWNHPLFKKTLGEFFNVRFLKYGWMNEWDSMYTDYTSVYA